MTTLNWMGVIILASLLGFIPAFIAKKKGHSFGLFWMFGFFFFPIALIAALLMKKAAPVPATGVFKDSFFKEEPSTKRIGLGLVVAIGAHLIFLVSIVVVPLLSIGDLPQVEIYSAFLVP
ncbi:MAG: hypothetical protein MUP19_11875, partial [Candidatus Aminicenantes bacterium]|nr:hypothetical protein [Candidatus Aminicenantes bacterium]